MDGAGVVVTRSVRAISAVVALGMTVALSSCGFTSRSSESGDLVGTWYSSAWPQISISFFAEGTLQTVNWPENVGCAAVQGRDARDAIKANRLDLFGSWSVGSLDSEPSFDIGFDSSVCERGSFPVDLVRQSSELFLCVYVPVDKDPDSMTEADVLSFVKNVDGAVSDPKVCLR